jgi:hypothetical protein
MQKDKEQSGRAGKGKDREKEQYHEQVQQYVLNKAELQRKERELRIQQREERSATQDAGANLIARDNDQQAHSGCFRPDVNKLTGSKPPTRLFSSYAHSVTNERVSPMETGLEPAIQSEELTGVARYLASAGISASELRTTSVSPIPDMGPMQEHEGASQDYSGLMQFARLGSISFAEQLKMVGVNGRTAKQMLLEQPNYAAEGALERGKKQRVIQHQNKLVGGRQEALARQRSKSADARTEVATSPPSPPSYSSSVTAAVQNEDQRDTATHAQF